MTGKQIAEKWFAAFNAQDLEELLALYHDHARHFSPKLMARRPETHGMISGKPALRDWWQDAFDRMPDLRYHPRCILSDGDYVFMEYLRIAPGEPDMNVGELLQLREGRILASKVFHG